MRIGIVCLIIIGMLTLSTAYCDEEKWVIFSEEENVWLQNHPVILVAPENDYAPIGFYEEEVFLGLSIDYLNWISETYQIEFEYVYYEEWGEILEALRNNEVDLQTSIVKTTERSKYLEFTDPYASIPNVVLIRREAQFEINEENFYDYRVGVIKDYAVHEYIRLVDQPNNLYEFAGIRPALTQLSLGEIDALVVDLAQASYYIQDMAISNIVISSDIQIPFEYKLRFAAPKESKILASILNKAIHSMPQSQKQVYMNKWINPGHYNWFDRSILELFVWTILLVTSFVVVVVAIWSLTLKRQVRNKTKELDEELKNSQILSGELKELTEELEERVNERSKRLMETNTELESKINLIQKTQENLLEAEKINALSRLVIGIAHRMNTPLGNGITSITYAKQLLDELKEHMQKYAHQIECVESYELINDIEKCIEKSFEYLKDSSNMVAEFNMVANYHYDNDIQEITLDTEIEQIVKIIKQQSEFRNYTFELDLQKEIIKKCSPRSLLHLVTALIDNSIRHGYLEVEEGVVRIQLKEQNGKITLSVSDDGQGIPAVLLENVMEPFVTSDLSSKGKGLGLFAVYNIVTGMMEGNVHIDSKEGNGTNVVIVFNE